MQRRGFLQLLGIGIAPALSKLPEPTVKKLTMASLADISELRHNEWTIRWSDWIKPANQRILVGHWVAINPDSPQMLGAYSSVPGGCDWFLPGQLFDTSIYERDGQVIITPETPIIVAEKQKQMGLDRLINFLDTEKYPPWDK